jgi:hypothetical protein
MTRDVVTLPDPTRTPILSVEEAGRLLGIGRRKAYEEANRFLRTGEGIPCRRHGRALRVPTKSILRMLDLVEESA